MYPCLPRKRDQAMSSPTDQAIKRPPTCGGLLLPSTGRCTGCELSWGWGEERKGTAGRPFFYYFVAISTPRMLNGGTSDNSPLHDADGQTRTESHNRPRGPHGPAAGRFWEPSAEMRCRVKRALVVSYSHPVRSARYPDPLPTRTVSHVPVGAGCL